MAPSIHDDERALHRLIMEYARRIDGRDCDGFLALFAPGAYLDGETFKYGTPAEIRAVPDSMKVYTRTYHTIWNYLFDVQGDTGTGEVYTAAHHLTLRADGVTYDDFIITLTYRDRYVRSAGGWQFAHRNLDVVWTETKPVTKLVITPQLDKMRKLGS